MIREMLICHECGDEFVIRHARQRYCSKTCFKRSANKKYQKPERNLTVAQRQRLRQMTLQFYAENSRAGLVEV